MKPLQTLIACFAIAALTSFVDASDGIHLKTKGCRIDVVPVDPGGISSTPVAVANCDVQVKRRNVLMHWSASPFTHVSQPELVSDTVLSQSVIRQRGRVFVFPRRAIDRTDIASGDNSAAFLMGVSGNGKVNIRLKVGIENPQAAAGKHCSTVVLTVLGH